MEGGDGAESSSRADVTNGSALLTFLQVLLDRLLVVHGQPWVDPLAARARCVQCGGCLQSVARRSLDTAPAKVSEVHARGLLCRHPSARVRPNLLIEL